MNWPSVRSSLKENKFSDEPWALFIRRTYVELNPIAIESNINATKV